MDLKLLLLKPLLLLAVVVATVVDGYRCIPVIVHCVIGFDDVYCVLFVRQRKVVMFIIHVNVFFP